MKFSIALLTMFKLSSSTVPKEKHNANLSQESKLEQNEELFGGSVSNISYFLQIGHLIDT